MLQILGDKLKGKVAWTIILLIAVVFVFLSVSDTFSFSDQSVAAKVNGQKILRRKVDALYERFAAQQAEGADVETLKQQVLSTLIRRAALLSQVNALRFEVSDEQIAGMLLAIPAFQVDGQFSKEQYQKILAQNGYTDASFRTEMAEDARLSQFEQGLIQSSFSTPQAARDIAAIAEQKRDVGYLLLPANHFQKKNLISEAAIADFYDKNKQSLVNPEKVSLEYVRLSLEGLIKTLKVSPEEVSDYYKAHQSDYTLPERVHARHLLISLPAEADPKLAEQALARVEGFLKQLKEGADFAALAKRWSMDTGSAPKGGDLGWMTRGQMVPAFETVAFALKPGAYSEAVRTDFGYHIIQVLSHKAPEVRAEAAVAPAITEQLKLQKAQEQFEKARQSLEKLASAQEGTFDLSVIGNTLGLTVQQLPLFSADGGEGLSSDPMLRKIAFSEAFLKQGYSLQPILLSDQSMVLMRLKDHKPASQQTLAEAQKTIRAQLMDAKIKERIAAFSDNFVKRLEAGENPAFIAKEQGLVWHTKNHFSRHAAVNDEVLASAFQLSPPEAGMKFRIGKFITSNGAYVLLALYKVIPGDWSSLDAAGQQSYERTLADISGKMDYFSVLGAILETARIELGTTRS